MAYNRIVWLTWLRLGVLALLKERQIPDSYSAYLQKISGRQRIADWSDHDIQMHVKDLQQQGYLNITLTTPCPIRKKSTRPTILQWHQYKKLARKCSLNTSKYQAELLFQEFTGQIAARPLSREELTLVINMLAESESVT